MENTANTTNSSNLFSDINSKNNLDFEQINKSKIKNFLKKICIIIFSIFMINLIHWSSIQFISTYCTKPGIWGFIENFMSLGSPMCQFVNYIQFHLSVLYINVWITSALSLIAIFSF